MSMWASVMGLAWELRATIAICFGMQWLVFAIHGAPKRSEKYYDIAGSVTYAMALIASFLSSGVPIFPPSRQLLVTLLILAWCIRLGTFLFKRIHRDSEDRRMRGIKKNLLLFLGAWNMQGTWCVLVALPAYLLNLRPPTPFGIVDAVGLALWAIGWSLEVIADRQKYVFRDCAKNKGKFITTGLWAWSRHPNYFGEILLWIGLAIVSSNGLQDGFERFLVFLSPAFTAFLLVFVSGVPLLEKYADKTWGDDPAYQQYKKSTSVLILWPPAQPSRETCKDE